MHTINLPYKQGYVTPVPAAVVVNTYEFREAEDPSTVIKGTDGSHESLLITFFPIKKKNAQVLRLLKDYYFRNDLDDF